MRRSLALLLSSLIPLTGCASYTPSSAPIPKGADMLAWHAEGGLAVGADPYVDLGEQEAVFDVNLMAGGVLAINILVQNDSDRQLLVRRTDIVLVLPDGTQLRPAGASLAASKMESGAGGGHRSRPGVWYNRLTGSSERPGQGRYSPAHRLHEQGVQGRDVREGRVGLRLRLLHPTSRDPVLQ